jgi:Arc/MetJ-type ribon-helix-helix transcriptional regulator
VRPSASATAASEFLGVRLTLDELRALDAFQKERGFGSRSDAVREVLRRLSGRVDAGGELPVSVRGELEDLVEDGWARDPSEALTLVVTLGLRELSRLHSERVPSLRRAARELTHRRESRRRWDSRAREMLDR